jgi:glutathione S-transferase
MAIARYAAKLAKLYPEDPLEALFVDEVIETVSDISNGIPRNADPEVFKKLREEYAAGKLKTFMTYLAEKLEKSPYTTGANLTVADIALYGTLKYLRKGLLDHISADYDSQWPVFQTFIDTLENNATFAPYKL